MVSNKAFSEDKYVCFVSSLDFHSPVGEQAGQSGMRGTRKLLAGTENGFLTAFNGFSYNVAHDVAMGRTTLLHWLSRAHKFPTLHLQISPSYSGVCCIRKGTYDEL